MGLLKTVFEVNLSLLAKSGNTGGYVRIQTVLPGLLTSRTVQVVAKNNAFVCRS
jgi:hypothetical protein